ncbi:hypothetical protein D3C87_1233670 [compost metagenome]
MLHRADHEPQVTEHREHLADGQVGEQHGKHGGRTENIDAELEQQTTGPVRCVGFPLRVHCIVTNIPGPLPQAAEEKPLTVAGAHFLDRIQGFSQRLGEARSAVVLEFLQVLDPFAQLHRGVDHQRVEQQNQQRQLPVHPHQDPGGADQCQHGDEETAEGFADEFVQCVEVGNQVRGHRAAAQAFVFTERDALEAFDQADANAIDDVLGQRGEQLCLHHVEQQRRTTQGQRHHQHQTDVARGFLPDLRECEVHDFQRGVTVAQQHFIYQQRQQQRDRHTAQGRQHGYAVGDP